MDEYLVGTKKHGGCHIDNYERKITKYDMLNLVEKIQGKKCIKVFKYQEIDFIKVYYAIVKGVRMGTVALTLTINLKDGTQEDVRLIYSNTTREDVEAVIRLLQTSKLKIIDHYHLFDQILNSKETIWNIIDNIDRKRMNK